jgi:hypothetical protein
VLVSALAWYFYEQAREVRNNTAGASANEVQQLVARISKLIALPEGEIPTVATVSDPEKLKGQAFFAQAKAGDKVLLYQQARKAYLYDPVQNRVLEVAPIRLDEKTPAVSQPAATSSHTTTTTKGRRAP